MNDKPIWKANQNYPNEQEHRNRWQELAHAIAAESQHITDAPDEIKLTQTPGQLEILGSGIEAVGFTSSDEMRIREADQVFYCVADPATVVWLKDLRPDAYDLYVLYDDSKQRYLTYMQMTEAMLYYVRKGQKVVAIYYGHPGIFVLSTHRAIQIARREGHRAVMRPGISALDMLCADLGVDPSQPGMQMYEATDMLIRRRQPDPGLHLVLWQVGLIGELGYRRQGYINSHFSILLDYLTKLYGEDHPVINYVGSRYPGVEPVIDHQTIKSMRIPSIQKRVTGISTFYLPPKNVAPSDKEMLIRLGLLKPGQSVRVPNSPLRVIDRYGTRERAAFRDFENFDIPRTYHWQADTAAARFILALREDGTLRDQYNRDPQGAVYSWNGALSDRDKRMLALRDAGAMQIAAKGLRTTNISENKRLLNYLLNHKTATRSLRRVNTGQGLQAVEQWSHDKGFSPDWHELPRDFEIMLRKKLYPWTGLYLVNDQELSLSIYGRSGSSKSDRVDLNGQRLQGVRFRKGILSWSAEHGNSCSGYLQADIMARSSVRRLVGAIWPPGTMPESDRKVVALERVFRSTQLLSTIAGRYLHCCPDGTKQHVAIEPIYDTMAGLRMQVMIDGQATDKSVSVSVDRFKVGDNIISLSSRSHDNWPPTHLHGQYRVRVLQGHDVSLLSLYLGHGEMKIDGESVARLRQEGTKICWSGGPSAMPSGEINALLDPISLRPMLFGQAQSMAGEVLVLRGMVPITEAEGIILAANPQQNLPHWAWRHITQIVVPASQKGGLFLWHAWERTATNLRRIRTVFRKLR